MLLTIRDSYRSSFSGLSRETWLLSSIILINRAGTMVVPFLGMYITQSLHWNVERAGVIIALFGVGALMGSGAAGFLIDKIGFRKVQILSSFVGGLLFMLLGQMSSFWSLCAVTTAVGFVAEAFRPANMAAVAAYANPENLTRSYSLNRLAMNIGWAVGSSSAGLLAAINYHLLFWVEGTAFIIVSTMVWLLLPEPKAREKKAEADNGRAALEGTAVQSAPVQAASPWKDKELVMFLFLVMVYFMCFVLMFRLVPVYWKEELHIGESMVGLLLGLNGVIITLLEMVLVKRWEAKNKNLYYIVAGVLATGVGFLFLLVNNGPVLLWATVAVVLFTFGEMLAMPFISTAIMQKATDANRGKYASAFALSYAMANVIGPAGGAFIAAKQGYMLLWVLLVVICLVCAWGFSRARMRTA